jgi:hypothetical protein
MGRKSRLKKERNSIKHCNITLHKLEDNGKTYKVEEYHPNGTEHMTYETFQKMQLAGVTPVPQLKNVLRKLIFRYPKRRFAIAVEENYEVGEHDIPIFVFPALDKDELVELERVLNNK